jgi:hypothetical protein
MSNNIDLSKFLSEPSNILERLYKETPIAVLTKEEFDNLPLNENYIKNIEYKAGKEKRMEEKKEIHNKKIERMKHDELYRMEQENIYKEKIKKNHEEVQKMFDEQKKYKEENSEKDPREDFYNFPLNKNFIYNNNERSVIHEQE